VFISGCAGEVPPDKEGAGTETKIRGDGAIADEERPGQGSPDRSAVQYGFFPTSPDINREAILRHYENMGKHADFVLFQYNVPWNEFSDERPDSSRTQEEIVQFNRLAERNGLGWIYVIDPLNGLDRREFHMLPEEWEPSFADPGVRKACREFALWIVETFKTPAIGLASEINTYLDNHPEDAAHYISLYREIYDHIKSIAPETLVFVTFQWDDLNNMIPGAAEGGIPFAAKWEQIEQFEPKLDIWAISSYPYFIFNGGREIPADYYTPLLNRTDKPIAFAEGGFSTKSVGAVRLTPQDQVDFLRTVHDQLGGRLIFRVNLLLQDFNYDQFGTLLAEAGMSRENIETLGLFAHVGLIDYDGTPKPGLDVWDGFRAPRK
jgi:hypothetical protein